MLAAVYPLFVIKKILASVSAFAIISFQSPSRLYLCSSTAAGYVVTKNNCPRSPGLQGLGHQAVKITMCGDSLMNNHDSFGKKAPLDKITLGSEKARKCFALLVLVWQGQLRVRQCWNQCLGYLWLLPNCPTY